MICFAIVLICRTIAYPMEGGIVTQVATEEVNATLADAAEDEISWYKPIAVILKPATEKDLEERLKLSPRTDEELPFEYRQHPDVPVPFQQQPLFPWDYESASPWASPFARNSHRGQPEDGLKNYYASLNFPGNVQANLLALARMGLVAIPKKEIGRHKVNETGQKEVQVRANSRQGEAEKGVEIVSQDKQNANLDPNNHNHNHNHNNKKHKNQWVHELVGPPGPIGAVGPAGNFKSPIKICLNFGGKICKNSKKAKME